MAELLTLFLGDGRSKVLNLSQALANEYDLSDFSNSGYPGVADELGIQSEQSRRLFRVAAGTGFPLEQTTPAIEFPDGIDIGDEVVASGNRPGELDLQITSRLVDLDSTVLAEAGQEHDSLTEHAIPGISLRIMQLLALTGTPLRKQDFSGIFPPKECSQCLFESATEEHRCPGIFLFPAVEIAIPIPPRTGEVLADLRVAICHSSHLWIVQVRGGKFFPTTGGCESVESEQRSSVDYDWADLDDTLKPHQLPLIYLVTSEQVGVIAKIP
jgi:hypothetical protein